MLNGIFNLPWPWWGYARISRLDIAMDQWGVEISNWVWDMPMRPAREAICRQRQVRTFLGAKKGSPLVVYNKAKQDPAYAGGQALTRVEYRLKNLGTVDTLTTLPNPFASLDVFDTRKLSLALPDPLKHALMLVGHPRVARHIERVPEGHTARAREGIPEDLCRVVGPHRGLE